MVAAVPLSTPSGAVQIGHGARLERPGRPWEDLLSIDAHIAGRRDRQSRHIGLSYTPSDVSAHGTVD